MRRQSFYQIQRDGAQLLERLRVMSYQRADERPVITVKANERYL